MPPRRKPVDTEPTASQSDSGVRSTSAAAPFGPWKTIGFALIPAALLLLVSETTVRLLGLHTRCHGTYDTSPLWSCDPILSFQLKKGLMPAGKPLNQTRYRGREFTKKKPGVYRVLALGDSTTFGIISEETFEYIPEPYPERLERLIDERIGTGQVEVLNGGVPGYNSFMAVMQLRWKLRGLDPDLITVRHGWNDHLMSMGGERGAGYRELDHPLLEFEDLLLRTALYPFLHRIAREVRAYGRPEHEPTVADIPQAWKPDVPLEQYKHNLRRIVELGHADGAAVWLLTTPHAFLIDENRGQYDKFPNTMSAKGLIAFSAISSFDRLIEIHEAYAEATRQIGRELGVPVVDMEAAYRRHSSQHLFNSTDVVHPTQEGHNFEAGILYERMVAEGILTPSTTAASN